jgi:hypothetical protein
MRRGWTLFWLVSLSAPSGAARPASTAEPRPGACTFSPSMRLDGSFDGTGYRRSPEARHRLLAQTRQRFTGAAVRLCAVGVLRPADLARLRTVIVQNGEGATEPLLYGDALMGPDFWVFQYAFQDGGPPPPPAFEHALRCWKRPQASGCDAGD